MSHVFQLSEEQYAELAAYAAQHNQTPESLFHDWIVDLTRKARNNTGGNLTSSVRNGQSKDVPDRHDDELSNSPLLSIAGMFAIGEPGWADRHDEYLAEAYMDDHAENK